MEKNVRRRKTVDGKKNGCVCERDDRVSRDNSIKMINR